MKIILFFIALCNEAKRRCNNSKLLYIIFGIYGRDTFTVFFHRLEKKLASSSN